MKLQLLSVAVVFTVIFTPVSFAKNDENSICPTIAEIQKAGVHQVARTESGTWNAFNNYLYYEKHKWQLSMGSITASTEAEALVKANTALKTLALSGERNNPPWGICDYEGTFEGVPIGAVAMTGELKR